MRMFAHEPRATRSGRPNTRATAKSTYESTQTKRIKNQRTNDQALLDYIHRILCQTLNDDAVDGATHLRLPSLTSSNEIDLQLYGLIAVILNQFVKSWYQRLTPDHEFFAEVVPIIAHCTRCLEGRLRHIDLEDVVLDEIPRLLAEHLSGTS